MIISSARTDYKPLEGPEHDKKVRDLMQDQHKTLMKQLRRGEFDDKIIALMGALEPDEPDVDESPVELAPPEEVSAPPPAEVSPPPAAAKPAELAPEPIPAQAAPEAEQPAPEAPAPEAPAPATVATPESMEPIPALEPVPLDVKKPTTPDQVAVSPEAIAEDLKPAPALGPVEKVPTFELEMPDDLDDLDDLDLDDEATVRFTIPTNFSSSLQKAGAKAELEQAVRAQTPALQRLDIKPQTLSRATEEAQTQIVDRPDEPTKVVLPPQAKKPALDVEVTEIYDMRHSRSQEQDSPPPIPTPRDEERETQPLGQREPSSVIVDRPPTDDLLGESSLLNSPTFYSELRKKKEEEEEEEIPEPKRPSGVFGKPVPGRPQVVKPEERSPVRSRRAGVFPVSGSPSQKPPHPDPNVRRKAPSSHAQPVSAQGRQQRPPTERPPWSRPPASQGPDLKSPAEKRPSSRQAPPRPRTGDSPVVTRPAVIISTPSHGKSPGRARPQAARGVRPGAPFHGGRTPTPATPARVVKMQSPSIFGSDLITERSLDEVILSYLAEDIESSGK